MSDATLNGPPAQKDPDAAHPVAGAWRPTLREVVRCFARGDYGLSGGVPGVEPVAAADAEQIRDYVADYGATLVELPEDAWRTSEAQWLGGRWEVFVDLWTAKEGRSDMVLYAHVVETGAGPRFTVLSVYVP